MPSFLNRLLNHIMLKYWLIKKASDAKCCKCRDKETCPLEGNCLIDSIMYRRNITTSNKEPTTLV